MTDRLSSYGYSFQIKVITSLMTDKTFLQQIAVMHISFVENQQCGAVEGSATTVKAA